MSEKPKKSQKELALSRAQRVFNSNCREIAKIMRGDGDLADLSYHQARKNEAQETIRKLTGKN